MYRRRFYIPLTARVLLTLIIWFLAILMSACSTSIQLSTQVEIPRKELKQQSKSPALTSTQQKKQHFFAILKPVVVLENKRILLLRQQILRLKARPRLNRQQQARLQDIAGAYGVTMETTPSYEAWQTLLARVDIIPLEMALVQAANESAWGQSRFAKQGNNYFGQWCYKKGCGMVPKQRIAGASHEVRRFANVRQSVRAYLRNINTSAAYAEFRRIRHSLRVQSRPLDAYVLVAGLKSYSERGMAYVKTIQAMIRSNRMLIKQSLAPLSPRHRRWRQASRRKIPLQLAFVGFSHLIRDTPEFFA